MKHVKGSFLAWVVRSTSTELFLSYVLMAFMRYSHRLMEHCFQPHTACAFCAIMTCVIECMRVLFQYNRVVASICN